MRRFGPTVIDYLHLFRALTYRRVVNLVDTGITWLFARYFRKFRFPGGPWAASFEPTTTCNLRCPECPSGLRSFHRPTGKADMKLFGQWAEALSPTVFWLNLYFQGEPLLHPDLETALGIAHRHRFYTAISTNGHFLTEENCRMLVQQKLGRLIISLDGFDQQSYVQYRRGGDFSKVIEGIERMIQVKKTLKSTYPYLILQTLALRSNEERLSDQIRGMYRMGVDAVEVKTAQFYHPATDSSLMPCNDRWSRYRADEAGKFMVKSTLPDHCSRFWGSVVITWDGRVLPCCYDKDGNHNLGNLPEKDFLSIWHGERRKAFAKKLYTHRKGIDICRNCDQGLKL